jgi:hypothetical protein
VPVGIKCTDVRQISNDPKMIGLHVLAARSRQRVMMISDAVLFLVAKIGL